MRRVSILGSTGSVGRSTVELLKARPPDSPVEVVALAGGRNVGLLARQARELKARVAVTAFDGCYRELAERLAGSGTEARAGAAALAEAARIPADWVMSAIVGIAGLEPGYAALESGGVLALANKESMVAAGPLMRAEARRRGARMIPVDSELSAIFQALGGADAGEADRIILTGSGGPFREWSAERMAAATPRDAAAHPTWDMGLKISVDSASMFNKALELLETKEFFEAPAERIEIVIHPQSVVHSLVGFRDGSLLAQLGPADMKGPIGFALNWPERRPLPVDRLSLLDYGSLEFERVDEARFPAIRLAREAAASGGMAGAALNAAKEAALEAFLAERIGFLDMARCVEDTMEAMGADSAMSGSGHAIEDVLEVDALARARALEAMGGGAGHA